MSRPKIDARDVLRDIRLGMHDADLMEKYKLSASHLQSVFKKFLEAGVVRQSELDSRPTLFEETVEVVFKFPAIEESKGKELGPLMIQVAKKGLVAEVRRLLDRRADVNARGTWGMTPLMWAASKNHRQVVKLLLDHGADANAEANNNSTALMWAAFGGHHEVAKMLLERGARVDARSNCGRTALISAAFNGHEEVVRVLLEYGADASLKDQEGRPAHAYAAGRGHTRTRDLLREFAQKQ
jgi:uncharacterized protein